MLDEAVSHLRAQVDTLFPGQVGTAFLVRHASTIARQAVALEIGLDQMGPRHRLFPELFADAGYQTINVGKLHHNGLRPGFMENPRVGGDVMFTPFGVRADMAELDDTVVRLPGPAPLVLAGRCPIPAEGTTDARRTDEAIRYLRGAARPPFLLRVSFSWPHTPVLPPAPFDTKYDPQQFSLPAADRTPKPRYEIERRLRLFSPGQSLSDNDIRLATAHYYGLCAFIDGQVGRLLQELAESPHADDTIIVFHADHGTLLGEHGLWQKETFYDPVVKVPFIIAWPRGPRGVTIDSNVQLIDLAPTLLTLAGIRVPDDMEGVDLLAGHSHDFVFSEVHALDMQPGEIRRMIHDGTWRFEATVPFDHDPDGALYRTADDPAELSNLIAEPSAQGAAQRLLAQLVRWAAS
jgi:arylsulfatase A-like enzyme